jgi:hypothetical protein
MSLLDATGVLSSMLAHRINKINYLTVSKLKSKIRMVMDKLLDGRDYAIDKIEYTEKIIKPTIQELNE